MALLIGIAVYKQVDSRQRPVSPHWALVINDRTNRTAPQGAAADDSANWHIYQIVKGRQWAPSHRARTSPANSEACMGVIFVNEIHNYPGGLPALDQFIRSIPDGADANNNPSGLLFWSCEAYVIRVLHYLQISLPCRIDGLYDRVKERIRQFPERNTTNCLPYLAL